MKQMRVISMAQTTAQFLDGSKTVTRRVGWKHAKVGMRLRVVRQAQGLPKGANMKTLGYIQLTDVRTEPLSLLTDHLNYGTAECMREGFPNWSPEQFVRFFCATHAVKPSAMVTRLQFVKILIDDGKGATHEKIPAHDRADPVPAGDGG
jgi:hypothetical protein